MPVIPINHSHVYRWIKILLSFWKGSPKEHSCEMISKSDKWFQRTRVFDGIKFCEQYLKRCLKKLLMMDDRHWTNLKASFEHVVLRWAKKKIHHEFLPWQMKLQFFVLLLWWKLLICLVGALRINTGQNLNKWFIMAKTVIFVHEKEKKKKKMWEKENRIKFCVESCSGMHA